MATRLNTINAPTGLKVNSTVNTQLPNSFINYFDGVASTVGSTGINTGSVIVAGGAFRSGSQMTTNSEGRWLFPRAGTYLITGWVRFFQATPNGGTYANGAYVVSQFSPNGGVASLSASYNASGSRSDQTMDIPMSTMITVTDPTVPSSVLAFNGSGTSLSHQAFLQVRSLPF